MLLLLALLQNLKDTPQSKLNEIPSLFNENSNHPRADDLTVDARMATLENYFEKEDLQPEYRLECSISSDTLEALENAEKLVREAKRTIVEAKSRVSLSDNIPQKPEVINLNDDLLEIKCIVAAKFDEANGKKSKSVFLRSENTQESGNLEAKSDRVEWKPTKSSECKKCLFEKKFGLNKQKKTVELNPFPNFGVQRGPKIDIRNALSVTNVEKLEIKPHSSIPPANTGNFKLRHEASTRGWINDECSLIDAGVQTSLRDSLIGSKFDEPMAAANTRSRCSDLDQNNIDELNLTRAGEIKDRMKIDECQGGQVIRDSIQGGGRKLGQGSFMDFLIGIKHSKEMEMKTSAEQQQHESDHNSPHERHNDNSLNLPNPMNFSFNSDVISLKSPDVVNVEKIINKIDKKLKIVNQLTENLQTNIHNSVQTETKDLNTRAAGNMNNDEEHSIKILLNPRSRMSSTSSSSHVSSDLFQPPERFSTPLNNWKIDGSSNGKLLINDEPARAIVVSTSEPVIKESNNTFDDGIVPITRNNLSTPVMSEKNEEQCKNSDKISTAVSSTSSCLKKSGDTMTGETASLFPSYSSDKSENSQRSLIEESQAKQTASNVTSNNIISNNENIVNNNKNITEIGEESQTREADLRGDEIGAMTDNEVERNSGNVVVISDDSGNKENPVHTSSSIRDATSNDISKLSSEIHGSSGDDKKCVSLHTTDEDKQKSRVSWNNGNEEKSGGINNNSQIPAMIFRETHPIDERISSMTHNSLDCKKTSNSLAKSVDSTGSSSANSISLLSSKSNKMIKPNSTTDYSEGELFPPSSCAYSLGEVIVSENGTQFPKICVNLSNHTSSNNQEAHCSPGELLETDIDSDSSGFGRGHAAV